MLKIAEMRYNGANSIFLRILIAKKYALPFRVIDALVRLRVLLERDSVLTVYFAVISSKI